MKSFSEVQRVIPKANELCRWKNPYKVVSLLDHDRDKVLQELPGYEACRILRHVWDMRSSSKAVIRFIGKLRQDGSFLSMCLFAVFDIVLNSSGADQTEWETIASKQQDDIMPVAYHDDDDDSLIVEAWPYLQSKISWKAFLALYRKIENQLCMITLDEHPLAKYAKKTLFEIPNFEKAIEIAHSQGLIPFQSTNKLQCCQLLLNHAASLPKRVFGVLMVDPLLDSNDTVLTQSCLPTACLDLSEDEKSENLVCRMISLYELQHNEEYTISTSPPPANCSCFKCTYEKDQSEQVATQSEEWILMAQRLAHVYFQQGNLRQARVLYRQCHDYYSSNQKQEKAADMWHSMAAVSLTESKFLEAQRHWKEGCRYQSVHSGIALQLEKIHAYKYLEPYVCDCNKKLPPYRSYGGTKRLFVCPEMIPSNTCQQLIAWAKEYASSSGWTTSRHYAVPTTDIPIHRVPNLLTWFVTWIRNDVMPLLQEQFKAGQQFYVHDAFLVRYSASSSSTFLPLHYDESTHSLVLALNDDFEGGGTYFYDMNETITPNCGSLVSFRGNQLLHGGNVVTKGERFILAVFLYLDEGQGSKRQCNPENLVTESSKRFKEGDSSFSFGFF